MNGLKSTVGRYQEAGYSQESIDCLWEARTESLHGLLFSPQRVIQEIHVLNEYIAELEYRFDQQQSDSRPNDNQEEAHSMPEKRY